MHEFIDWLHQHQAWPTVFALFIIAVGMFHNLVALIQLPLALIEFFRTQLRSKASKDLWLQRTKMLPAVSILIPAYNEEVGIVDSVKSTLAMQYPSFEVIVINDGSSDDTMALLKEQFQLRESQRAWEYQLPCAEIKTVYESSIYANLIVIDKVNAGAKADALNAGLNLARCPVFCTLDADSLLESRALIRTMEPFIKNPNKTIAVGGSVRVLNGCKIDKDGNFQTGLPKNLLARLQVMEYLRAFLIGRLAWNHLGILTIISGAFAVIDRQAAMDIGGFDQRNIGEDYDLILRLHRHFKATNKAYRIEFVAEPVCWTEVPSDMTVLATQRTRWQQGAIAGLANNKAMMANPRYGRIGMVALPVSFIIDVVTPIVEVLGYLTFPFMYLAGLISWEMFAAFVAVYFVLGIMVSLLALVLQELSLKRYRRVKDLASMLLVAVLENLGYRQLNSLWRIIGSWRYFRGEHSWGTMTRRGRDH